MANKTEIRHSKKLITLLVILCVILAFGISLRAYNNWRYARRVSVVIVSVDYDRKTAEVSVRDHDADPDKVYIADFSGFDSFLISDSAVTLVLTEPFDPSADSFKVVRIIRHTQ